MLSALYKQDYYLWLEKTVQALKAGNLDELDIRNLIEEIDDMGKSERRALKSNLTVVLLHLLKYKYQPTHRSNSWLGSILEHRLRLRDQLEESPRLKPYLKEVFAKCYGDAALRAPVETGLPSSTFPDESPFTAEESLDISYLPQL